MQPIITKFLPCTDSKGARKGARIKASCERGILTIGYPHELNVHKAHEHAALELCRKFIIEDLGNGRVDRAENSGWALPMSSAFVKVGGQTVCVHLSDGAARAAAEVIAALLAAFDQMQERLGDRGITKAEAIAYTNAKETLANLLPRY